MPIADAKAQMKPNAPWNVPLPKYQIGSDSSIGDAPFRKGDQICHNYLHKAQNHARTNTLKRTPCKHGAVWIVIL